ncbi:ABC transporter permease [Yersinia pestis]|uniref:ABC transporter permease n=1 Tax=Yersinia pestis TaxID=632 RepID=UPI000382400F|nr:ABC transporter permease [Yersinia pestis]AKS58788.1 branched-chain amino acid transport system / permease component family protein [Yersinia pestis 1412]AKS78446.1 branched-chain amino acid transport system / permease component family protein [Yersinia pestis 1413]AKS88728.1 branched-chain amino acid transport system / permease component family protein [Yersinia pestis 8787]AKS95621.1 branched-chain amino acid transport system / permease component family protein [Yersinia pestis 3770]AKS99
MKVQTRMGCKQLTRRIKQLTRRMLNDKQLNFLVMVNMLVITVAATLTQGAFVDLYNLQTMAGQVPELGLLAMGGMLAMIVGNGGIDLSGIALANLAAVVAGTLTPGWVNAVDSPLLFTVVFVLCALLVGLTGGLINGVLIAYAKLTPILCTLGTQLILTGFAVVISHGSGVKIGFIEPLSFIGDGLIANIPFCFALFILLATLLGLWLRFSATGIRLYLLGTNLKAAQYIGIAQQRLLVVIYTLSGTLAAIAGIIIAARSTSATADYGSSYVLIAILIAVMAGVRPEGGYGRMGCLLLSATALQFLSSTFTFLDVSSFFRDCAWGALLLFFIIFSRINPLDFVKSLWRKNTPSVQSPVR